MKKFSLLFAIGILSLPAFSQTEPAIYGREFTTREAFYRNKNVTVQDAEISFLSVEQEGLPRGYQGVRVVFTTDQKYEGKFFMNGMMAQRIKSTSGGKPIKCHITFSGDERMGYLIKKYRPIRK
jgi:hypothetical protein